MWNLNYFLNIYINYKVAPEPTLVFDAYGASFLYLFSAAFGLAYTFFLPQKISSDHPRVEMNRVSLIFGMIGTGFIVCTFAFATAHYLSYSDKGLNIGGLNIYFALSASIIGTFIGSALFGRGRVGYKEVLVGSVSGAVMISSIAPIFDNIGIIIMLGLLAGLISGIYMQTLHKAINKTYIYDSLGLFGPFLINSFIGSMVVAPSVLDRLVLNPAKTNFNIDSVNNTPTVDTVGFQLVYVGVSLGIGLFSGLFAGLFSMCEEDKYGLFANSRFFRRDYSLYRYVESDTRT